MAFNIGEVLTRAWQILWKYKILWLFGFLASCGTTGGGGNFNSRFSINGRNVTPEMRRLSLMMERLFLWLSQHWWVIIALALVLIVVGLLAAAMSTVGRIGLIRGVFAAEQESGNVLFGEILRASFPYFWRIFWLNLIPGLLVLFLLLPIVAFGFVTAGVGFLCLFPLLCLLIPVTIALALLIEQANRAIVLEDLGLLAGIQRGWEVLKSYPGQIILMAIVLYAINLVVLFLLVAPVIIVVAPWVLLVSIGQQVVRFIWLILAVLCLYTPIAWFLESLLVTYVQSAWTLTYLRLTRAQVNPPQVVTVADA